MSGMRRNKTGPCFRRYIGDLRVSLCFAKGFAKPPLSRSSPVHPAKTLSRNRQGFCVFRGPPPHSIGRATARCWLWRTKIYVYRIASLVEKDRYYVGLTDDVERRLAEHNAGESFSTKDHRPWKCISSFWFESPAIAERLAKISQDRIWSSVCQAPLWLRFEF